MLTREPQRCPVCRRVLPDPPVPIACAGCGWVAICPEPATWSRELKSFVFQRYLTLLGYPSGDEREGWLRMMLSVVREAREIDGQVIRWGIGVHDAFPIVLRLMERQQRSTLTS